MFNKKRLTNTLQSIFFHIGVKMKQLKITLSFLVFSNLGFSSVVHANLVRTGEDFAKTTMRALTEGFEQTPRQKLLTLMKRHGVKVENIPTRILDDLERGIDSPTEILIVSHSSPSLLDVPFVTKFFPINNLFEANSAYLVFLRLTLNPSIYKQSDEFSLGVAAQVKQECILDIEHYKASLAPEYSSWNSFHGSSPIEQFRTDLKNGEIISLEEVVSKTWNSFRKKLADSHPAGSGNTIVDFETAILNARRSIISSEWQNYSSTRIISEELPFEPSDVLDELTKYILKRQTHESLVDLYTNPHSLLKPGHPTRFLMASRIRPLTKDAILKWWEDVRYLMEAEASPLGRGDVINNISSHSLKRGLQSYVQEHYRGLTRSISPEQIEEVLGEDPVVQTLLKAERELNDPEYRTFVKETLEPFFTRNSSDQTDNAASRSADSGITETNG